MSHDLTAPSSAVTETEELPPARLLARFLGAAALISPVAFGAQYAVDPTGMLRVTTPVPCSPQWPSRPAGTSPRPWSTFWAS